MKLRLTLITTALGLSLATVSQAQTFGASGQESFGIRSHSPFSGQQSCLVLAENMPGMAQQERKFVPIGLPSKTEERNRQAREQAATPPAPAGLLLQ